MQGQNQPKGGRNSYPKDSHSMHLKVIPICDIRNHQYRYNPANLPPRTNTRVVWGATSQPTRCVCLWGGGRAFQFTRRVCTRRAMHSAGSSREYFPRLPTRCRFRRAFSQFQKNMALNYVYSRRYCLGLVAGESRQLSPCSARESTPDICLYLEDGTTSSKKIAITSYSRAANLPYRHEGHRRSARESTDVRL